MSVKVCLKQGIKSYVINLGFISYLGILFIRMIGLRSLCFSFLWNILNFDDNEDELSVSIWFLEAIYIYVHFNVNFIIFVYFNHPKLSLSIRLQQNHHIFYFLFSLHFIINLITISTYFDLKIVIYLFPY